MKKINTILFVICALALSSCKGFLDVTPTNQADASTSIQTAADAQVFMNGIMRKMSSSAYYGRNLFMYGDAKGGDFAISSQGRGLDGLYTFNHTASSGAYSGFWEQIYHCLLQVNTLLVNIDKIEKEGGEDLAEYKGQALTLRAIMYFDLVRLYGLPYNMSSSSFGVPLTLEPLDASAQLHRASVKDVYDQIIIDLKAGESLLSKEAVDGYINYYANKAIQARVYLFMENYGEALKAAETIINDGVYSLYSNDEWISSWSSEFGKESIFELAVYPDEADLGDSSLGFYLRRLGHGSTSAMGWFMASDYYLERLGEDTGDIRWGIMDYDEHTDSDGDYYRMGSCYKYSGGVNRTVDGKKATFPGDGKSNSTAVNIKVIRLSEIYLIASEAAFKSDLKDKAAKYLQEIRKRSPNLTAATQSNVTFKMIMDERSKELFAEGQRFFDMIRWNQTITYNDDLIVPSVVISHREKTIDRTYGKIVLPISQDEINANPSLKEEQNPAY
jgi:starch-binding outer membrane protein, SusD/RagB family